MDGACENASARSHQAATPRRRADAPAAWTSWIAWGSPDAAIPLGSEIAGTPALLQGAQREPSPVEPSPAGAGAGAVGDKSASCASRSGITSSRNARRARFALTYVVAG